MCNYQIHSVSLYWVLDVCFLKRKIIKCFKTFHESVSSITFINKCTQFTQWLKVHIYNKIFHQVSPVKNNYYLHLVKLILVNYKSIYTKSKIDKWYIYRKKYWKIFIILNKTILLKNVQVIEKWNCRVHHMICSPQRKELAKTSKKTFGLVIKE